MGTAIKSVRTVEFQVGVDVLGFPIYMQHEVYTGVNTNKHGINMNFKGFWVSVIQKIIKQH